MLGAKLLARLATSEAGGKAMPRVTREDAVLPCPPARYPVENFVGDLSAAGEAEKPLPGKPDGIFHLQPSSPEAGKRF